MISLASALPTFKNSSTFLAWCTSTIAPMGVAGSSGLPCLIFSALSLSLPTISSLILECTKRRELAEQTSPWLKKIPNAAMSAAFSKSASGKIIFGLFPPVSSHTCFILLSPAYFWKSLPTAVDPVNTRQSTSI